MQAGVLDGEKYEKRYISARRVYCENGLAPTILTATGGGAGIQSIPGGDNPQVDAIGMLAIAGFQR